ncbi:MAG: glycerol kinase [Velocimicrobium sp.]
MEDGFILGIDQSTQGTKALIFDEKGCLLFRSDRAHEQKINEKGWVEHNPNEIYENTIQVVKDVVKKSGISKDKIKAVGISNQRETALVWDKATGKPIYNAIVWQCSRGEPICKELEDAGMSQYIKDHSGLPLSPYFSAAKIAWILRNVDGARKKSEYGLLCCGTIDSWLVYRLTNRTEFKTDYSNASRTQLFDIEKLAWSNTICQAFGINSECLARVCDSNAEYGFTDFDGFLETKIPIHAVFGDSHAALYGQGCLEAGMIKATYGTGSSIMMNTGTRPVFTNQGIATSLAWSMDGMVHYVLEGNINYTGAVITWLQKDLGLITSPSETQELAKSANKKDRTYLVPAFTGLSAPYWDSEATATLSGMTRITKKAEIVRAALECIAYQITDIVDVMSNAAKINVGELRVDGGPTKNDYLMQFQSDLLHTNVYVPKEEELSGIGAAYAAGIAMGMYKKDTLFSKRKGLIFEPTMEIELVDEKKMGWREALFLARTNKKC